MSGETTPGAPDTPGTEVTPVREISRPTGTAEEGTAEEGTAGGRTAEEGTAEEGTAGARTAEEGTAEEAGTVGAGEAWELSWASLGDRARKGIVATAHGRAS